MNQTNSPVQQQEAAAKAETKSASKASGKSRTLWSDAFKRLKKNKLAVIGICWIVFVVLVALTADLWAQQWLGSPTASDSTTMATTSLLAPCAEHPFGTDSLGRDILVRVIYGARVSLSVGILATAISTAIGLVMGALAGFYGGIWDTIIMRAADIFLAFPYVLFVVSLIAVIGRSLTNVFVAIGILGWPSIARVFRSAILTVKENDYVDAARAMGASELRCLHRRLRDDEHRRRHPHRELPVVPRHGRHPAHALVGFHDSGRPDVSHDGAVDDDHARPGHSHDRARVHPSG